jgi:hypothetical protein
MNCVNVTVLPDVSGDKEQFDLAADWLRAPGNQLLRLFKLLAGLAEPTICPH